MKSALVTSQAISRITRDETIGIMARSALVISEVQHKGWPTLQEIRHTMALDSAWSHTNNPFCDVQVR